MSRPAKSKSPKAKSASPKAPRTPKTTKTKAISALAAAAIILGEADAPMTTQDLVARILERGLWTTAGKTPAATLFAAMSREIKAKGSSSRFVKAERGLFTAAG